MILFNIEVNKNMKNMKRLTLCFIICIGLLIGCKKETGPATKTENPAKATIEAGLVVDSVKAIGGTTSFEFGPKLYFSKNGKVTKLGCKIANTGNFRVSFWDYTTKDLIAATTVNITDSTKFTYNDISPIPVTANTRYVISVNNTSGGVAKKYWLYIKKSNTTLNDIFPFTTGSVTYEKNLYKFTSTSAFPTDDDFQYGIDGIADLQFEYTE